MADWIAKKLGNEVEKGKTMWLKTVNSKEAPTTKVAQDLEVWIGQWASCETAEAIPLDDYNFVTGLFSLVGSVPRWEYLILWKGLPKSEASWEPIEDLWQFEWQIKAFDAEDVTRASLD